VKSRQRLLLLLVVSMAACRHVEPVVAQPVGSSVPSSQGPVGATTLGSGDVFEVRVFQEPDLSGAYRLSSTGTINFPLCGTVHLGGLSTDAAAHALTSCLASGYLRNPQVSIFVKEYNSKKIFVFGEVQKPGTFQYEDGMTIVQAITLAGGFGARAAKNSTSVTRSFEGTERRVKVAVEDIGLGRAENFSLRPGDIIFVPESLF
jgi:protein involved in polysaccharide export with SLBB domain